MDILAIIKAHGLTIRQIPHITINRWHSTGKINPKHTPFLMDIKIDDRGYSKMKASLLQYESKADNQYGYRFDDNEQRIRKMIAREITIPEHAGWWMCQSIENTSSMIGWNIKEHNLAPTLEESVGLYLSKLKQT